MTAQNVDARTSLAVENAEIVRRGYAAFNAADIDTLERLFDENAEWHTPGRGILAGDQKGQAAIFGHFGQYAGETAGSFKAELRSVTANGEGLAIAMHHNSAERNSKRLDVDCCIVFKIENGRVVDGREYFYDLHAWDAFWS